MFKIIVTALIVVVAAILIMAATRPDSFRVERSIRVSAPPEKIFHYVNDFHQWGVGSGTQVTWFMDGPSPCIAKVMGLFFNMDRLIGGDFETGLANLKAVSET
jgi:hypothetical protein